MLCFYVLSKCLYLNKNIPLHCFQLVIYAGPNTNSRKVTEYGGNTLGYGSRSVLGTGWPKDLVKVRHRPSSHTTAIGDEGSMDQRTSWARPYRRGLVSNPFATCPPLSLPTFPVCLYCHYKTMSLSLCVTEV